MLSYATRDDVYNLGLSARAFAVVRRPVDLPGGVVLATGAILLIANGYSARDLIRFDVVSGGTLPPEFAPLTYYAPIPGSGGDVFRVGTLGNPTVPIAPLASAGTGWGVVLDSGRRLDMHLEDATARLNGCLTAYSAPLTPEPLTGLYHPEARGLVARMAARTCVTSLQVDNAAFRVAIDRLERKEASDEERLRGLLAGELLNPQPADQTSTPDNAAFAAQDFAPTPWRTGSP